MKFHRIQNPKEMDEEQLAALFDTGADTVVLQFVEAAAYNKNLLQRINQACERFGARLNVRFYGHYGSEFDCQNLSYLPSVRSLNLDCLMKAVNLEALYELTELEEFVFGVFEADVPRLLEDKAFFRVRRLCLSETRKKNIDLAPLSTYRYLENLFLNSHSRHIESLAGMQSLQKLSLGGIGRSQKLDFIGSIIGLKTLTYILGGRDNVNELAHDGPVDLELLRVRGLSDVNLKHFPRLERLKIEDQLQLRELDINPVPQLQRLWIFNCKKLERLHGITEARSLGSILIGQTALELETIFSNIPPSVRGLSLHGPSRVANDKLQDRIKALGLVRAF